MPLNEVEVDEKGLLLSQPKYMWAITPHPPCSIVPPALFPHEEVVLCFRSRPLTTIDLDTKPALSENIRKLEPPGGHKCIIGLHKLCFDEISSLLDFELKP